LAGNVSFHYGTSALAVAIAGFSDTLQVVTYFFNGFLEQNPLLYV